MSRKGESNQRGGGSHRVGHDVDAQGFDFDLDLDPSPESDFFSHEPMRNLAMRRRAVDSTEPVARRKRRNPFFWGLGFAILLIWVFSFGIFVGRGNLVNLEAFRWLEGLIQGGKAPQTPPEVEVAGEPHGDSLSDAPVGDANLTFYKSLNSDGKPQTFKLQPVPETTQPVSPPSKPEAVAVKPPTGSSPATKPPVEKSAPSAPPAKEVKASAGPPSSPTPSPTPVPTPVPTPAPKPTPPPKETEVKKEAEVKPVAVVSARSTAAAPSEKTAVPSAKVKPSPPESAGTDPFTIQVTAAREAQTSKNLVAKLKSSGYDAYEYKVELNGRTYYRVRVGRFKNRAEADQAMKKLADAGYKDIYITRETRQPADVIGHVFSFSQGGEREG